MITRQRSNSKAKTVPLAGGGLSRAGRESLDAEDWPALREWDKRLRSLAATTFRRLGIEPKRVAGVKVWASQVLKVLGPDSFAEFTAMRAAGKVIWCNFELARQLGFEVPQSNQLTADFENQLLAALSFKALENPKSVSNQETITMYADRYGGEGVGPALGAGRAGFLPYGNLYVKGVGFTPLFKHNNPDDFVHSHGAVYLSDCFSEALFGEVNENLFVQGSTRAVAIIDQGRSVTDPAGKQIPVALLVRTGTQLRPAHLLGRQAAQGQSLLDKFVRIARATGQLVTRQSQSTRSEIPDIKSTLLRIIDDHAETAADGFRWRMIHGAISSSNMEMSGAMLDLPTQSTQPRTAPILLLDYADWGFGAEHRERALQLVPAYRKLVRNTPISERKRFNVKWFDIVKEMEKAYAQHLQVKLLSACGLKPEVARRIHTERRELASHFTDIVLDMAVLKNPGSVLVAKSAVEYISVLDVFHLLKTLPSVYFRAPAADHRQDIFQLLKPVFSGNRFQAARQRTAVELLVSKFADGYRELMQGCEDYADEYYGDLKTMQASISARAAFENEPLEALYYRRLHADMDKVIASYRSKGDVAIIRQAIDQRILASLRNVDALLAQGDSRRLPGGAIELEMRTIDAVNYSVRAWNDNQQTRRLHVTMFAEPSGARYLTGVNGLGPLTKRQLQALRYRFTFDGRESFAEVGATLRSDKQHGLTIDFDEICSFPPVGRLEGAFYVGGSTALRPVEQTPYLGGYVFAIPDREELMRIIAGRL